MNTNDRIKDQKRRCVHLSVYIFTTWKKCLTSFRSWSMLFFQRITWGFLRSTEAKVALIIKNPQSVLLCFFFSQNKNTHSEVEWMWICTWILYIVTSRQLSCRLICEGRIYLFIRFSLEYKSIVLFYADVNTVDLYYTHPNHKTNFHENTVNIGLIEK